MSRIPNLTKPQQPSSQSEPTVKVKLAKYVGFFVVGYVLASAIFMLIQTQVALNPQLVTLISIIIGAYIAVLKFSKQQKRKLSNSESNRLTLGSVASIWVLTVVYFLGLWLFLFDEANRQVLLENTQQQPFALLSAVAVILLLTLVSTRLSLWVFNRLFNHK